jgi:hypothetical protein
MDERTIKKLVILKIVVIDMSDPLRASLLGRPALKEVPASVTADVYFVAHFQKTPYPFF